MIFSEAWAVHTCKVSCRHPQGVEVSAQSLYEAVAQAPRVFREYECGISLLPPASRRRWGCPFLYRVLRREVGGSITNAWSAYIASKGYRYAGAADASD